MKAESPPLSGRASPLAKERALDVNSKQWGIDTSALNQLETEEDAAFDRVPTEAETWSLVRITSKLSDGVSISTYLETLGYSKSLSKELANRIASARSGRLEKPDWVKAETEATTLLEKAQQTEKRSAQLIEAAKTLKDKIERELTANLESAQEEKKSAEAEANSWGWVPFSGAIDKLSKATDAELAILDEIARLKQEVAESEAGAAVLCEAAALEATRAEQLRADACRMRVSRELRERASLVADAAAVLDVAEAAFAAGDRSKAQELLAEGAASWGTLGLRADASIGATSLPGRLSALTAACARPVRARSSSSGAGYAQHAADDEVTEDGQAAALSPEAAVGVAVAVAAAAAGAGWYYLSTHGPV